MKKYFHQFIAVTFVAVIAAGCASAPARFYTLNSAAVPEGPATNSYAVVIEPVSIPAEVDRPQFTVLVAPNQVAVDEFNRWAGPLNENIGRAIAGDLAVQLGTPRVTSVPLANFKPDVRVAITIQTFQTVPGKMVRIDALWAIRITTGVDAYSGHTVAAESVTDDTYASLAAAHSRALARVSSDIAAVIRSEIDKKP